MVSVAYCVMVAKVVNEQMASMAPACGHRRCRRAVRLGAVGVHRSARFKKRALNRTFSPLEAPRPTHALITKSTSSPLLPARARSPFRTSSRLRRTYTVASTEDSGRVPKQLDTARPVRQDVSTAPGTPRIIHNLTGKVPAPSLRHARPRLLDLMETCSGTGRAIHRLEHPLRQAPGSIADVTHLPPVFPHRRETHHVGSSFADP